MSSWTFKRDYRNADDVDVRYVFPATCTFIEATRNTGGSGKESDPYGVLSNPQISGTRYFLLSGGNFHKLSISSRTQGAGTHRFHFIGNSRDTTKVSFNIPFSVDFAGYTTDVIIYPIDVTVNGGVIRSINQYGTNRMVFDCRRCVIKQLPTISGFNNLLSFLYTNCVFDGMEISTIASTRHMFSRCRLSTIAPSNLSLVNNCDITVDQTGLSTAKAAYYMAYYNCKYKFSGTTAETEFTYLIPIDADGNNIPNPTADDYKAEFIRRATNAGLTIPEVNNMPLGRWIFSNDGKVAGDSIYQDSEIYNWEIANSTRVGVSDDRPLQLPIVLVSTPSSFSPYTPHSDEGLVFNKGNVSFAEDIHISDRHEFFITSNIIPFLGKKEITNIVTPNYLNYITGVLMDSMGNIDFDNPILSGDNAIVEGERYLVRSGDKEHASVSYNGSIYDTSLAQNRTNIIVGVAGVTSYSTDSGNPVLYHIKNPMQFQSIQVRIVNKIPDEKITGGNLLVGYWYLVEHDTDQSNTTDYVTYEGEKYYVGNSFLVYTELTFSKSGNVHLRRCWSEEYNPSDAQDRTFWQYEQKPKWCDIELGVTKCMLKNNNLNASEMERDSDADDFNYISSGHEMYNQLENGTGGTPQYVPVYIRGAYMQIRLAFSTLNIM